MKYIIKNNSLNSFVVNGNVLNVGKSTTVDSSDFKGHWDDVSSQLSQVKGVSIDMKPAKKPNVDKNDGNENVVIEGNTSGNASK